MNEEPKSRSDMPGRSVNNTGGTISGVVSMGDDARVQVQQAAPQSTAGDTKRLTRAQIIGAVIGAVAVLLAAVIALFK